MDFSWVSDPKAWVGLLTLVSLEIVLGIDNVVFISILAAKLPAEQQDRARKVGIALAVITRILLLFSLTLILRLTNPWFTLPIPGVSDEARGISGRDLILIIGGLFLLAKATHEIHHKLEGDEEAKTAGKVVSFTSVIVQILLLDIVFSLDSVITAVGMIPPEQIAIMILAVIVAAAVMVVSVGPISGFVEKHPTVKMLALSFLLLIGMTLVGEGFEMHIPKGYIYFAMGFSVLVEVLNLRMTGRKKKAAAAAVPPVALREPRR
jgi:predicted tellurium resistance membrane protein TerC